MKRYYLLLAISYVLSAFCNSTIAYADDKPAMRYVDALNFRMINHAYEGETWSPYTRFPSFLQDSVSADLWARAKNSAGIGIRFRTNSTRIGVRYNLHSNFHMAHMADTGIKGTDLYILMSDTVPVGKSGKHGKSGKQAYKVVEKWQYVNTNRPTKDSIQQKIYVENMDGSMHECMIYLPLYDGINWLEIGVDSASVLEQPAVDNPRHNKVIVGYGTSILHGGCASRTGMVATSMMQRDLNVEFVNWGTSGEGKMVYPVARAMTAIPNVIAYVIDPVPNCTQMMCDTLTYDFIKIIRDARPEVPIIMVEGPMYPYAKWDSFFKKYLPAKNEAFRKNYDRLKTEDPKNLYYVTCEGLTGLDEEGTVDGIHLTDLGFRAYADKLETVLREIIKDL